MLSIIIPAWNQTEEAANLTAENIAVIRRIASVPTELILIDNGSKYPGNYGKVDRVFQWRTNRGIAPAWNHGMAKASGEYLAFLTTSVTPEPGWDAALVEAAQLCNIAFPWTDEGDGVKKHRSGTGIAGWCFMLSRKTASEVGQFDETFVPAWYEDTDFFHRSVQLDIPLVSVPSAVVKHKPNYSSNHVFNRDLLFLSQRLRYSWKWGLDPNQPPPFWQNPLPEFP